MTDRLGSTIILRAFRSLDVMDAHAWNRHVYDLEPPDCRVDPNGNQAAEVEPNHVFVPGEGWMTWFEFCVRATDKHGTSSD